MKKIIFVISVLLNALFIFVFVCAAFIKTSSFSFYDMKQNNAPLITAAVITTLPETSGIIFNPVELNLKKNQKAHIQFSLFQNNKQINRLIETLYDRDIINVTHTGYGLVVTALQEGECSMQTLTEYGVKDIAVIKVSE
jgi:hypothetical protein